MSLFALRTWALGPAFSLPQAPLCRAYKVEQLWPFGVHDFRRCVVCQAASSEQAAVILLRGCDSITPKPTNVECQGSSNDEVLHPPSAFEIPCTTFCGSFRPGKSRPAIRKLVAIKSQPVHGSRLSITWPNGYYRDAQSSRPSASRELTRTTQDCSHDEFGIWQ